MELCQAQPDLHVLVQESNQLAAAAGISRTYLARLEAAKHDPTLRMIERLAKALKVKPAELLT